MTEALIRLFIREPDQVRDSRVRQQYGMLSGGVGLACNLLLFLVKLSIGLLTGAISVAADAVNNLSDGLSCLISMIGFKLAGRKPDAKHPFGYGRTEYIAGLVVSFLILLVGFEFLKTSFFRIITPSAVQFSWGMLGLLALSMLVKLWMGLFNRTIGTRIDSPTLMAAMQDSLNDVITTGVVIAGMIAGRFTTLPVDGYVGVLVALFILWAGIGIARDTLAPLIGEAADPAIAQEIESIVLGFDHIVGVHDLIIHNYGAGRSLASLHAEVPDNADIIAAHEAIDDAEKSVWQRTGVFLVIHMDPIAVNDQHVQAILAQVEHALAEIDPALSMHDFRVVDGARHINLVFDVVVPFSYGDDGKQRLMTALREKLHAIDPRYQAVVTFDHKM